MGDPSRRRVLSAGAALGAGALAGVGSAHGAAVETSTEVPSDAQVALSDARLLHDVVAAQGLSPVMAARLLAYGSIAAALVTDGPDVLRRVLLTPLPALPGRPRGLRDDLATAAALSALLPQLLGPAARNGRVRVAAAVRLRLEQVDREHARSVRYGRELGSALAAWASTDGCQGEVRPAFRPRAAAGSWSASAGTTRPVDAWISRRARPFAVPCEAFPPSRPLSFDLSPTSAYREQVEDLVELTGGLGAEQERVARFWAAGPGTGTPAGMWHLLAAEEALRRGTTGLGSRTVLAVLDLAVYDALLRCWEVKYVTSCARPAQVVPLLGDDYASWAPLLPTPPFPEYTSGHSSVSGAAAEVLKALLGAPEGGVEVAPAVGTAQGPVAARRFPGWADVAQEASLSRQLGGIHFAQACEDGLGEGRRVARRVLVRLG